MLETSTQGGDLRRAGRSTQTQADGGLEAALAEVEQEAIRRRWLDQHGLSSALPAEDGVQDLSRYQRARYLLDHLDRQVESARRQLQAEERRDRPSRHRVARLRQEIDEREDLICRTGLFSFVHQPAIGATSGGQGAPYRPSEVACQFCGDFFPRDESFFRANCCDVCWRRAKGEDVPGPISYTDDLARAVAAVLGDHEGM